MAAQSAKKFVYQIQAEYSGQQSLKQLQNDLNNIARIEAFREAGRKWQELNEQLRAARENARRLRQEMQASGGGTPLQQREYEQAQKKVADLRAELTRQRTALDAARAGLQSVGIAASQAATQYAHLQQAAAASAKSMAARNTLGIRGDADIRAEMELLKRAYRDLATSGTASTDELRRAAENLRSRLRALRTELQGVGKLDLARSNLGIRADSAIRAEMELLKRAYRDLATSGTASTQELQRAAENLRARLRALRQEMQGGGSRVDRARGLLGIRSDAAIEADVARLRRAYETLRQSGTATAAELSRAHQAMTRQIAGLRGESDRLAGTASKLQGLRTALAGFAAAFAASRLMDQAKSLFRIADEYAALDAKIRLVTQSEEEAARVRERLYSLSQRTGTAYVSNADAFAKLALSMREVGISGEQTARIIEVVNKSLSINGSSAGMAGAFMLQFSQAMASGVLQGDEFRSMMENNGYFAGRLAQHLQTNIAGLRQMSREGKLTQAVLLDFFEKAGAEVDKDFAAIPMRVSGAVQAVRNAWEEIIDASNRASGASAKLVESLTGFARYLEDNREGIQEMLADIMLLITRMAELGLAFGKFLADNKEIVVIAAQSAAALAAVGAVVKTVTMSTAALSAALGALATVTKVGIALAGTFAVVLGASVGAIAGAVVAWRDMRRAQEEAAAAERRYLQSQANLDKRLEAISASTGVVVRTFDELRQALADGRIHYDELTRTWVAGAKQRETAEREAMTATRQVTQAELKAMAEAYKKYADEIKRIQDDITGRQRSLAAELREMGRADMGAAEAWRDMKREASEYAEAARRAAEEARALQEAGDTTAANEKWKEAVKLADDAKSAYKQLNREVKDGDRTIVGKAEALKTAMDGVREAGELAIDILKQQQDAAREAMREMEKTGGMAALADSLDAATRKWLEGWDRMRASASDAVQAVGEDIETGIGESADAFGADWDRAWEKFRREGEAAAKAVERAIDRAARDRQTTITVREGRRFGGLVGAPARFARGGRLPGYGGGDRVQALLEAGEFVVRKEAVRKFGAGFFAALNNLRLPELPDLSAIVGAVREPPLRAAIPGGRTVHINLTLPSGDTYQMTTDPATAARIEREQERWWNLRSSNKVRRGDFARTR